LEYINMTQRGTGNTGGIIKDVTTLATIKSPNGRRLELLSGQRFLTSAVDGGSGVLLASANFANPLTNAVKSFDTLADALADTGIVIKDAANLAEHSTGNGGGAIWDAFASGTFAVGAAIFDVFDHDTLSLQLKLRKNQDGKNNARQLGLVSDATSQNAVMSFIVANLSNTTTVFDTGVYIMSGIQASAQSNFTLEFIGKPVFKLADNANTFAFRLSGCSDFSFVGTLYGDGNKALNTTTGNTSASAANGQISIGGASSKFSIGTIKVVNAWTNGVAIDSCSDFTVETLQADESASRGVTINACSDFLVDKIKANEATRDTAVYVLGCADFDIDSINGKGSRGSNCILFETGNSDYHIGSMISSDCHSGPKIENNNNYAIDSIINKGATVGIGVTVNGGDDWAIGNIITKGATDAGLALLTAEAPIKRGHIGSLITTGNGAEGLIVQTALTNAFESVVIDSIQADSNIESNLVIDGLAAALLPISGQLTIGEWISGTPAVGKFDIEVTDLSLVQRGKPNIGSGYYTTNYSDPFTLDTSTTPNVKDFLKFNNVAQTANTGATTITRWDNWLGDNRIFYILIQDNFTTFANGTGAGRILVQGASVATALGEMWQASFINDIWYMHKIS
jgi:hypothetical protein